MLKRIIVSTIGLAVLTIAAANVAPSVRTFSDPPSGCFPFECPDPNGPPDTRQ